MPCKVKVTEGVVTKGDSRLSRLEVQVRGAKGLSSGCISLLRTKNNGSTVLWGTNVFRG